MNKIKGEEFISAQMSLHIQEGTQQKPELPAE